MKKFLVILIPFFLSISQISFAGSLDYKGLEKISKNNTFMDGEGLPYPDDKITDKKNIFGMVDVKYVKDLKEVTLAEIKADPFFDDFPLVKQSRLSVMPVKLNQWKKLIKMSEKK